MAGHWERGNWLLGFWVVTRGGILGWFTVGDWLDDASMRTLLILGKCEEMLENMEKARETVGGMVIFRAWAYAYPTNQMSEGSFA